MKLLFINNSLIDFNNKNQNKNGGIEHCNIELAKSLSKLGHDITLVSKIKNKQKISNITNLPLNSLNSFKSNNHYDIVVSSNHSEFFQFQKKTIKVLWLHNQLQIEKSIRKKQLWPIIKYRPHVVFVSDYLKKKTSLYYPFLSKTIIPNGCSELFFNNQRSKIIKPIFVWTNKRDKGLNDIIDIWCKKISIDLPIAELHIHGITKSKKYISNIDYSKFRIKFFGLVSRNYLANKYKFSAAMLHSGYDETFCISALEALSSGMPVITIDRTALAERVINNFNGYKVNNFDDMADIAISLFKNKTQLKCLSNNAVNHSKKFKWDNIAISWNKYFKKLKLND
jgi:glycosyltransferase involved in cell wall biosynthesis